MENKYDILWLNEVVSTQSYLISLDLKSTLEWKVIATNIQSKGKGQGENKWESEDFKNLTFSFLLKPLFLHPSRQFIITQIISLGICDFLSNYIDGVKIKWPNDIYIGENKICGILIQNQLFGNLYSNAVCGIGININQTKFNLPSNPTSLKIETNRDYNLNTLLVEILNSINLRYEFAKTNILNLDFEYKDKLLFYNNYKNYIYNGEEIKAKIINISEFGHLILETKNNGLINASLKDITFIIRQ